MLLIEATAEDLSDSPMLQAKDLASKSTLRFKLGAVIKYGKSRIGAYNSSKTHSSYGCGRYQSLHAESHAIMKAVNAGFDLSKSEIYIYRDNGLISKPCSDCQNLIRKHKIRKVIYTNESQGLNVKQRNSRKA